MNRPRASVLIVSDAEELSGKLRVDLSGQGLFVHRVSRAQSGLEQLESRPFEIVLVDWGLGEEAKRLTRAVAQRGSDGQAIALVATGVSGAVEAMRAGAFDVVTVPYDSEGLAFVMAKAVTAAENTADEPPAIEPTAPGGLIGSSRPMNQVRELIAKAGPQAVTVLIRGESGTGKELVARALHAASGRGGMPFVPVHCAALPHDLLESELFGHEKGAFTGATARRPGRVEVADGGTLFLDEIGDVPASVQVKLLRLLQEREFEPLGSAQSRRADVRFLAATHRDLEQMVKRGEFREDLFYRLNVVPLWLPPLRARAGDVEVLARHFCEQVGQQCRRPNATLTGEALERLRTYRWPGNVRQLHNFIERLIVLSESDTLTAEDVDRELSQQTPFPTQFEKHTITLQTADISRSQIVPLSEEVRAAEAKALKRALKHTRGNRTLAARLLGISRATLYNKLQEYSLGSN